MKNSFALIVSMLVMIFFGCESNGPSAVGGGSSSGGSSNDSETEYVESHVTIHVLSEEVNATSPQIRLIAEHENWYMLDVTSDGLSHRDAHAFVLLCKDEMTGWFLYGSPTVVTMFPFSNSDELLNPAKAIVIAENEQGYSISAVQDIMTENYQIILTSQVDKDKTEQLPNRQNITMDDYFDEYNKSILNTIKKFFSKLKSDIGNVGDAAELAEFDDVSLLTDIWTKIAIPVAEMQLYSFNPDLQEELEIQCKEMIVSTIIAKIYAKIVPLRARMLAEFIYSAVLNTKIGQKWFGEGEIKEEEEEEEGGSYYPIFTMGYHADQSLYPRMAEIQTIPHKYSLSISKREVTENTASFNVSCRDNGYYATITSMGLEYVNLSTGERNRLSVDLFDSPITITGLSPFTTYSVAAYLRCMTDSEVYSEWVDITTTGELVLTPTSLTFSPQGGSKLVAINVPETSISSWAVTGPSWCSIEKGTTSFFVDVPEYSSNRTGNIKVTVKLIDNTSLSATLPVKQEMTLWNNTNWDFSGTLTMMMDGLGGETSTYEDHFHLEIYDVESNQFSFSGSEYVSYNPKIRVDENNNLITEGDYTFTDSGFAADYHWTLTIQRTGNTTAKAKFSGACSVSDHQAGMNMKGTIKGTYYGNLVE